MIRPSSSVRYSDRDVGDPVPLPSRTTDHEAEGTPLAQVEEMCYKVTFLVTSLTDDTGCRLSETTTGVFSVFTSFYPPYPLIVFLRETLKKGASSLSVYLFSNDRACFLCK